MLESPFARPAVAVDDQSFSAEFTAGLTALTNDWLAYGDADSGRSFSGPGHKVVSKAVFSPDSRRWRRLTFVLTA